MSEEHIVSLGNSEPKFSKKAAHTPSSIQADTLFTFMPELRFLIGTLKIQMLSPRYCTENIRYLHIDGIKDIAFPMKCFCDINLHRLGEHLSWYGYYGIAFSKAWGMLRGVQPVQYINPESDLRKDFTKAFNAALKMNTAEETSRQQIVNNYLFHELAFYKPYDGMMLSRVTNRKHKKCFTDECEWRFVPDVGETGFSQAYFDSDTFKSGLLKDYSDAMAGNAQISLPFNLPDIKYIIVKDSSDYSKIAQEILSLQTETQYKYELLSKTIIWENSKGDF